MSFNPSQPRDKDGKWSDSKGGSDRRFAREEKRKALRYNFIKSELGGSARAAKRVERSFNSPYYKRENASVNKAIKGISWGAGITGRV